MKDKYYNPNYLYLSGREYIVLEELENGRKKIKFPNFGGREIVARPEDLDETYKSKCEKMWEEEKGRIAAIHN